MNKNLAFLYSLLTLTCPENHITLANKKKLNKIQGIIRVQKKYLDKMREFCDFHQQNLSQRQYNNPFEQRRIIKLMGGLQYKY